MIMIRKYWWGIIGCVLGALCYWFFKVRVPRSENKSESALHRISDPVDKQVFPDRFNNANFEIIKINEMNNSRKIKVEEMIKIIKHNADINKKRFEGNDTDYSRGIYKSYQEVLSLIEKIEI